MKKIFKRGMSGLLAVLMAFTMLAGFGTTTAFAASETAESYMISFPRDGDAAQIYSEDTECSVEESVMQRMDIERVRTALKMMAPEERAIIQDFFFTESPIPVKELVEKYAMPKTSIYRKRDDALKKLKKILGNV